MSWKNTEGLRSLSQTRMTAPKKLAESEPEDLDEPNPLNGWYEAGLPWTAVANPCEWEQQTS